MKSTLCQSCHLWLERGVLIFHLALLFLTLFNPAAADRFQTVDELAQGIGDSFKDAKLNKVEIHKIPEEQNPLLQSSADANVLRTPTASAKETFSPDPHPQVLEHKNKKGRGFWYMLTRFWSSKPEKPPSSIIGGPDPALEGHDPTKPWWSRFWDWLTKSVPDRRKTNYRLPNMDHLREPFKAPWEKWSTMRYNPRTPTDTREDFLVTMRVLGDRLRVDDATARATWINDLLKAGASPLRREILSTDLFFELAKTLSSQEEKGAKYAQWIIGVGKAGNRMYKGHNYFKKELASIVERFQPEYFHGVTGTKLDHDFYRRPLSPLLLLKYRPELSELSKFSPTYDDAVQHMNAAKETVAALKDYVDESFKLDMTHEDYADEVLYYFRNLDRIKERTFMTDITQTGLNHEELEEVKRKIHPGGKDRIGDEAVKSGTK